MDKRQRAASGRAINTLFGIILFQFQFGGHTYIFICINVVQYGFQRNSSRDFRYDRRRRWSVCERSAWWQKEFLGVHGRSGKLVPFRVGVLYFSLVVIVSAMVTTMVSDVLTDFLPGLDALILAFLLITALLAITSYSR